MLVAQDVPLPMNAWCGLRSRVGVEDYRASGQICGICVAFGLTRVRSIAEPIFHAGYKSRRPARREYFRRASRLTGGRNVRAGSTQLEFYRRAATYAEPQGILLADTKFVFGPAE